MKLYIYYFFLLTFMAVFTTRSAQALEWTSDIILSPATLTYSGPADSVASGSIIGNDWSATQSVSQVFWCGWIFTCSKGTMEASSSIIPTGEIVILDGVSYNVFETGVPGIGFILGLKDTNATTWIPLQTEVIQTYPTDENNITATALGWSAKVSFVKTGSPLKSGHYTIPSINAAILTAYNNETATAKVIINSTTVIVSATGCTISTPNVAVNLGTVDMHILSTVDSTSELKNFNVGLQCDANISLNAVITDQTDQSNISQIVSLTPDSTATGVGVQFFYNGTGPLSLGPDSSLNSTPNQFFITSTSQAESLSLPFQARYIRTSTITPGTANALASITFSYQ